VVNPGFTADQVAVWLDEANPFRRARWVHWPDAARLAADLSELDFYDRFTPRHQVNRQVRQISSMMRGLADAWDDATQALFMRWILIGGTGPALSAEVDALDKVDVDDFDVDQLIDHQCAVLMADTRAWVALCGDPGRFSRMLRQAADETEWQRVAQDTGGYTHADSFNGLYNMVAATLQKHTAAPVSIRPNGPDARFVREVIEHVGLPWRPRVWRGLRTPPWARERSVSNGRGKNSETASRIRS
jgi:hypothetical protein